MLLLRFFMLLISTIINIGNSQDPYIKLVVMLVVTSGVFMWAWVSHGVYKKWYHIALEASFLFNLIALIVGTYQYQLSQSTHNQGALVYTSISITLVTFTGIVIAAVVPHVQKPRLRNSY